MINETPEQRAEREERERMELAAAAAAEPDTGPVQEPGLDPEPEPEPAPEPEPEPAPEPEAEPEADIQQRLDDGESMADLPDESFLSQNIESEIIEDEARLAEDGAMIQVGAEAFGMDPSMPSDMHMLRQSTELVEIEPGIFAEDAASFYQHQMISAHDAWIRKYMHGLSSAGISMARGALQFIAEGEAALASGLGYGRFRDTRRLESLYSGIHALGSLNDTIAESIEEDRQTLRRTGGAGLMYLTDGLSIVAETALRLKTMQAISGVAYNAASGSTTGLLSKSKALTASVLSKLPPSYAPHFGKAVEMLNRSPQIARQLREMDRVAGLGNIGMTLQRTYNAAKLAAAYTVFAETAEDENGRVDAFWRQRTARFMQTWAFMATPAIAGWFGGAKKAFLQNNLPRIVDFALNTSLSVSFGEYTHSQQMAEIEADKLGLQGAKRDWFVAAGTMLAPTLTNLYFSWRTIGHKQDRKRAEARAALLRRDADIIEDIAPEVTRLVGAEARQQVEDRVPTEAPKNAAEAWAEAVRIQADRAPDPIVAIAEAYKQSQRDSYGTVMAHGTPAEKFAAQARMEVLERMSPQQLANEAQLDLGPQGRSELARVQELLEQRLAVQEPQEGVMGVVSERLAKEIEARADKHETRRAPFQRALDILRAYDGDKPLHEMTREEIAALRDSEGNPMFKGSKGTTLTAVMESIEKWSAARQAEPAAPAADVRYQSAAHGTPHTLAPEPGHPHGRFRLDKISERGRGASELGWGINFGPDEVASGFTRGGNLYKLDIPDDVIPNLLTWKKPVSGDVKQMIQAGVERSALPINKARILAELNKPGVVGYDIYNVIREEMVPMYRGQGQRIRQAASEFLAEAGVVGSISRVDIIRDREANNIVLWDQPTLDRITMLERNGQALDRMTAAPAADVRAQQPTTAKELRREARFLAALDRGDTAETDRILAEVRAEAGKRTLSQTLKHKDTPLEVMAKAREELDWARKHPDISDAESFLRSGREGESAALDRMRERVRSQRSITDGKPLDRAGANTEIDALAQRTGGQRIAGDAEGSNLGAINLHGVQINFRYESVGDGRAGAIRQEGKGWTVFFDPRNGLTTTIRHEAGHAIADMLKPGERNLLKRMGIDLTTDKGQEDFAGRFESEASLKAFADEVRKLTPENQGVVVRAVNKVIDFVNALFGSEIKHIGDAGEIERLAESLEDFRVLRQLAEGERGLDAREGMGEREMAAADLRFQDSPDRIAEDIGERDDGKPMLPEDITKLSAAELRTRIEGLSRLIKLVDTYDADLKADRQEKEMIARELAKAKSDKERDHIMHRLRTAPRIAARLEGDERQVSPDAARFVEAYDRAISDANIDRIISAAKLDDLRDIETNRPEDAETLGRWLHWRQASLDARERMADEPRLTPELESVAARLDELMDKVYQERAEGQRALGRDMMTREQFYFPMPRKGQKVGRRFLRAAYQKMLSGRWASRAIEMVLPSAQQRSTEGGLGVRDAYFHERPYTSLRSYITESLFETYAGRDPKGAEGVKRLANVINSGDGITARNEALKMDRGEDHDPRMALIGKRLNEAAKMLGGSNARQEAEFSIIPERLIPDLAEVAGGYSRPFSFFQSRTENHWTLADILSGEKFHADVTKLTVYQKLADRIARGVETKQVLANRSREEIMEAIRGIDPYYSNKFVFMGRKDKIFTQIDQIREQVGKAAFDKMTERDVLKMMPPPTGVRSAVGSEVDVRVYRELLRRGDELHKQQEALEDEKMGNTRLRVQRPFVDQTHKRSFLSALNGVVERVAAWETYGDDIRLMEEMARVMEHRPSEDPRQGTFKNVAEYYREWAYSGLLGGMTAFDARMYESMPWLRPVVQWTGMLKANSYLAGSLKFLLGTQWTSLFLVPQQTGLMNALRGTVDAMVKGMGNNEQLAVMRAKVGSKETPLNYADSRSPLMKDQDARRYWADTIAAPANWMERFTTLAAMYAAEHAAKQRNITTQEVMDHLKNRTAATTQSVYARAGRTLGLHSEITRALFPFQGFSFEAFAALTRIVREYKDPSHLYSSHNATTYDRLQSAAQFVMGVVLVNAIHGLVFGGEEDELWPGPRTLVAGKIKPESFIPIFGRRSYRRGTPMYGELAFGPEVYNLIDAGRALVSHGNHHPLLRWGVQHLPAAYGIGGGQFLADAIWEVALPLSNNGRPILNTGAEGPVQIDTSDAFSAALDVSLVMMGGRKASFTQRKEATLRDAPRGGGAIR